MKHIAFVFPGQGSQTVGMLADFETQYPIVKTTFHQASDALGYDLWALIQEGPEALLNQTEHTQVAMLTADIALFRILQEQGFPMPRMMAGHSLGEYAALVAAKSLDFETAVRLVARRGQVMQQAIPVGVGAMAAIVGLDNEQVSALCDEACEGAEVVTPANFNAIGQVVIAGHKVAVERAIDLAEKAQARLAKMIPVSVPCHCPLLKDASDLFFEDLKATSFEVPQVPVVSNVDLSVYQSADHIRNQLRSQLYHPVRWVETIQYFKSQHIEWVVECGPGKVLTGLSKRIDRALGTCAVSDLAGMEKALSDIK